MTYNDEGSLVTEQPYLKLIPLEALGVACVLEKWIDRIRILDVMDGLDEKSNLAPKYAFLQYGSNTVSRSSIVK